MHRHYSFFILTLLGSVLSSDITTRVQSKAHSRKFATLENPSKVPENIPKTTLTITSYVTGAISASATSAIPLANVKAQSRPVSRLSTSDKTPLSFITNATGDYPCSFPHWKSCKPTGSPAQIQTNYTTSPIIENEYCVLICPSVIPSLPPGDSKETYSRGTMERSTTLGNGTDTTRGSARGPHLTSHFTTTVSSMISQTTKPEMSALPFSAGGKNDQLEKVSPTLISLTCTSSSNSD